MYFTIDVDGDSGRRRSMATTHHDVMIRLSRVAVVALAVLATACGSSRSAGPTPLPTPAAPPAAAKPVPAAAPNVAPPVPHPFAYLPGVYRYEIRNDAVVTAQGTDRADTIATRAVVTYRITPRDSGLLGIEGTVDSFAVVNSRGSSPMTAGLPFTLTALPNGTLHAPPAADSAGVCTTPLGAVVSASRELLVSFPIALAPGTQWTDSLVTTTCRGTLPVVARSERRSQATWVAVPADWSRRVNDVAFEITRTSTTSIAGEGRAAGRQVALSGTGEGNSALYVDPELGVLLGAVGNSSTRLIVDSGTQRQEFVQTVRQRVTLLH
ncbi:MAG TPA: hypothetical protein VHM30_06610 [Gemmatimonadaceae bacterium]|nr:hypothetical protein [Gemmatimonadaceae bacterium]